jgi:ribosomal protein S18 acetylase RimI-like enzyme
MENIIIKKVTTEEIKLLQEIGKQTFFETFASNNTEENIIDYLNKGFSIEKLTAEVNNVNTEFYFVSQNLNIIGYLKLNFGDAQSEIQNNQALEIERIYVLKDHQRKNVGQLLLNKAFQIANEKNLLFIWLGVWEKNISAINFYRKNGFVEFDKHIFTLGNDKQTDIMMKLILKNQH